MPRQNAVIFKGVRMIFLCKMYTTVQFYIMSLVLRKPIFGVSDQVRHKAGRTATDNGYSHEIFDFGKKRYCTIYVAKINALISCVETVKLICVFSHFQISGFLISPCGPCCRVDKVADFNIALYHLTALADVGSSPTRATRGTSQVLLASVSGGFSPRYYCFRPTC